MFGVHDGVPGCELWPALRTETSRPGANPALDPMKMVALWRGEVEDEDATAVITGTVAIALRLLGRAASPAEADALAEDWWRRRTREPVTTA